MNYICIIITAITITIMLAVIFKLNPKKNQELVKNEKLNNIAKKFPSNIEVCKSILKMLKNETVKIEEEKDAKDCVYIAITDKIIIAGTQSNFTRIQTIAHECIHTVQDKRIQIANFIISNICILYFITIVILGVLKLLPDKMLFLVIYVLLSFCGFLVRSFLENDAMFKAKYLAKEYMEEQDICSKEEIDILTDGFEQINNNGIKGYNYSLFLGIVARVLVLAVVFLVR